MKLFWASFLSTCENFLSHASPLIWIDADLEKSPPAKQDECLSMSYRGKPVEVWEVEAMMKCFVVHASESGECGFSLENILGGFLEAREDFIYNRYQCPLGWSYMNLLYANQLLSALEAFPDEWIGWYQQAFDHLVHFYSQFTAKRALLRTGGVQSRPEVAEPYSHDSIIVRLERRVRKRFGKVPLFKTQDKRAGLPPSYCECHAGYDMFSAFRIHF